MIHGNDDGPIICALNRLYDSWVTLRQNNQLQNAFRTHDIKHQDPVGQPLYALRYILSFTQKLRYITSFAGPVHSFTAKDSVFNAASTVPFSSFLGFLHASLFKLR